MLWLTRNKLAAPCLALAVATSACSDNDTVVAEDGVRALHLQTGQTATYDSVDAVPDGWGICPDNDCSTLPPEFPCTRLGPGACLLNPVCGLRLRCDIEIADPIRPFEGQYDASSVSNGPADTGYPVGCELVCLPKSKVTCEQLHDPVNCVARADCSWQRECMRELSGCVEGQMCPDVTVCQDVCRPKIAETCDRLDERACQARTDCEWRPGVCPLMCAYPDCDGPVCEPFCQPKADEPACPPLPNLACPSGTERVSEIDDNGCEVDVRCSPIVSSCRATGCSGQICAAEDVASTCEWTDWYQCYKLATCETQGSGTCGWTPNDAFTACMSAHGGPLPACPTDCGSWCVGQIPADCPNPGCRCPEPVPDSCMLEYELQCPDGQIDACVLGTSDVHRCVPRGIECAAEIALVCPDGQIDGCESGTTSVHRCVPLEPQCRRGGCSGQLCVGPEDPSVTTCEWVDYYKCFELATCELQSDGSCGWTANDAFDACMERLDGPLQ